MFIYCIDKDYKEVLVKSGLQFVKEDMVGDKVVYLFALGDKLTFDELDKNKVFTSSIMKFGK